MEFTTGRIIFVTFFIIVFVSLMIFSYRKDVKIHTKHYKGSFWVLIFFILFVLFLFGLKVYLNF